MILKKNVEMYVFFLKVVFEILIIVLNIEYSIF